MAGLWREVKVFDEESFAADKKFVLNAVGRNGIAPSELRRIALEEGRDAVDVMAAAMAMCNISLELTLDRRFVKK